MDDDGSISKITYEFIYPDGTPANPNNLIQGYIRVQLNDNSSQLYESDHHLYGTFSAPDDYNYYKETLSKKIQLSQVNQGNFAYINIRNNFV